MTGDDCIEKIKSIKKFFDFSNLPKGHVLYNTKNRGTLGFFKLEVLCEILAAVFIRSKVNIKRAP